MFGFNLTIGYLFIWRTWVLIHKLLILLKSQVKSIVAYLLYRKGPRIAIQELFFEYPIANIE